MSEVKPSERELKLMIELKLEQMVKELYRGNAIEIVQSKDGITVRKIKKEKI